MTPAKRNAGVALALVAVLTLALSAPLAEHLGELGVWIGAHQRIAWIAFIASYVCAALLALPAALLTLAAGLLFGMRLGSLLVFIGSVSGAAAAFLAGRFIARDWVASRFARSPRYRALELATRSKGFLIVLLARLSPLIPYNVLNYGLSLTAVRFRHYLAATALGMPPVILMYVYLGTLARDLTELAAHPATGSSRLALALIALATLVLFAVIARITSNALGTELERARAIAGKSSTEP